MEEFVFKQVADSRDTVSIKKMHYDLFQDYSYRFKTGILNYLHFKQFLRMTR